MITETIEQLRKAREKAQQDIRYADDWRLKLIATIDQKQRELAALDAAIETVSRVHAPA